MTLNLSKRCFAFLSLAWIIFSSFGQISLGGTADIGGGEGGKVSQEVDTTGSDWSDFTIPTVDSHFLTEVMQREFHAFLTSIYTQQNRIFDSRLAEAVKALEDWDEGNKLLADNQFPVVVQNNHCYDTNPETSDQYLEASTTNGEMFSNICFSSQLIRQNNRRVDHVMGLLFHELSRQLGFEDEDHHLARSVREIYNQLLLERNLTAQCWVDLPKDEKIFVRLDNLKALVENNEASFPLLNQDGSNSDIALRFKKSYDATYDDYRLSFHLEKGGRVILNSSPFELVGGYYDHKLSRIIERNPAYLSFGRQIATTGNSWGGEFKVACSSTELFNNSYAGYPRRVVGGFKAN